MMNRVFHLCTAPFYYLDGFLCTLFQSAHYLALPAIVYSLSSLSKRCRWILGRIWLRVGKYIRQG
uniref:Uncharacterized protein n=1 Tax=Anguilla anguilla TaxID=7936 RepID=A0A0E9SEB7_ANGAN